MKKRSLLTLPIVAVMLVSGASNVFTPTATAASKSADTEYDIYPTPHTVEYGEGEMSLDEEIQVVYDETIDDVTKKKVSRIFEDHNLPKPETAEEVSDDSPQVLVGTEGSGGPVDQYAEETLDSSDMDFDKTDAYQLNISDDTITVLGKDTDAAFYGLVSFAAILDQSEDDVVRNLEIEDYANTKVRGFIEGFYGIPWSNEDRKSLMKFGGNFKTTSYIFAPKDDPYHREKWDELYPEEELNEISEMAKVGRENKTQFAWTISPLGEPARVAQEEGDEAAMELLDENTEKMLDKFDQLYDAGVRQFGVLGDDVGALPLDYVVGLMDSVSEWADEKGDIKDIIYTPAAYNSAWAWDGGEELNKLEKHFSDNIQIMWTGENTVAPVEQYTIDRFKNRDNNGVERRDPLFWLNWPVNDVDMTRVFLGKGDMLNPGVKNLAGVVTNPMQEAEASKVSIFAVADYAWNTETFDAEKSWKDSMKYVEPDATEAFHTLAKHMAHADPQVGMEADESEDIKELLDESLSRLDDDEALGDEASELMDELQTIADAGETFLAETKNDALKEELEPFVHALHDMVLADVEYLKAEQAMEADDSDSAKEHYVSGHVLREQSLDYDRPMLEGEDDVKAKPAGKRLQPFSDQLEEKVTQHAEDLMDVDVMKTFVQQYADEDKIENADNVQLLQTHLTSIDHFVDVESFDKAEKHMKNLKQLVENYQENGQMDDNAADTLIQHADMLIENWE